MKQFIKYFFVAIVAMLVNEFFSGRLSLSSMNIPQVRSKDLIGGNGSEAVDDENNLNKEKDDGSE